MKKCRLFDIVKIDPLPLVFDSDSAFFNKFDEYEWFLQHPLTTEATVALQQVFNLSIKRKVKNILDDVKPNENNVETPMHITLHTKISEIFDKNLGNCISQSDLSMWFVFTSEIGLGCFGITSKDLIYSKETGTTIELLIDWLLVVVNSVETASVSDVASGPFMAATCDVSDVIVSHHWIVKKWMI